MSLKWTALVVCAVVFAGCGGDDGSGASAGSGGDSGEGGSAGTAGRPTPVCERTNDCDDGVYCNGSEVCDPDDDNAAADGCVAGTPVDCSDGIECTLDRCIESQRQCENDVPDGDSDGHTDATCLDTEGDALGDDCDDDDASRFPGNTEICDADDHDEDCDLSTYGTVDQDGDGANDNACCNVSDDGVETFCGTDCKDLVAEVNPDAAELCDTLDNDCDGRIDEGAAMPGFVDADYDGYGDSSMPISACSGSLRFALVDGDCDDSDSDRNPGQVEVCDTKDNDCNTVVDDNPRQVPWYADTDGDGFGDPLGDTVISCAPVTDHVLSKSDCDDNNSAIHPAAVELCDGIDNNCNGLLDYVIDVNDSEDDDGDGLYDAACLGGTDCDDNNASTGLGGDELCDGRDNDCDDAVDEGTFASAWFRDNDFDSWGSNTAGFQVSCTPIFGRVTRGGDCADNDATRNPAATEQCNRRDDNCDGAIDGADADASCNLTNATAVCGVSGVCEIASCLPGFGNCDRITSTGCEELASSPLCDALREDSGIIGGFSGRGGDTGGFSGIGGVGGAAGALGEDGGAGTGGTVTITDGCDPQIDCGKGCVDLDNDNNNCGGCGIRCGTGACIGGACRCLASELSCDGVCINTRFDSDNCGACDNACGVGQTCSVNACVTASATHTVSGVITSPQGGSLAGIEVSVDAPVAASAITQDDGSFSMELPDGNYRFTPHHPNASMRFFPAHVRRDVTADVSDLNFNAERGSTVSGSVSYSGGKTGRIQVVLRLNGNGSGGGGMEIGVSVSPSATTWSVDGVPPGTYQVEAFMDYLGIGRRHALSPKGGAGSVVVAGSDVNGVALTLADPTPTAPSPPDLRGVIPGNNATLVLWGAPRDMEGAPTAERYNIYFRRDAPPTTTTFDGVIVDLPILEEDGNYLHTGLGNGVAYYYLVTAEAGGFESAPSVTFGPVVVGAGSSGQSVSGVVNTSNFAPTGTMIVVLFSEQSGAHFKAFTNPQSPQPYTIPGVQPGTYQHLVFIDRNGDGMAGPLDPSSDTGDDTRTVTVSSQPVTDAHVGITERDGWVTLTSSVQRDPNNGTTQFGLDLGASSGSKRVVGVRLIQGPGVMSGSEWTAWEHGSTHISLGDNAAEVGDLYVLDLTYADEQVERVVAAVRSVIGIGQVPTPLTPGHMANLACVQPTVFTWAAPSMPPVVHTYSVEVHNTGMTGGRIFEAHILPSTQFSVTFPTPGQSPQCAQQQWRIALRDQDGNHAEASAVYNLLQE